MSNDHYLRYCAIEEILENDKDLNHLRARLQTIADQIHTLLSHLTEEQRQILIEYLGVCAEVDQRIVEIACFCKK